MAVRCVIAAVAAAWLTLALLPRWLCGAQANALFDDDSVAQRALARGVIHQLRQQQQQQQDTLFYHTGHARFDGQSAIAVYQMTLLGLGQMVLRRPALRARYLPIMRQAANRLVDPHTLVYAAQRYGQHGVVGMAPGAGHAYLGYINLGLGMLRMVDPDTPHAALHDRLTQQLKQRLAASPQGLIDTYPGECWPPDVAAVAGSIGLHGAATGSDHHHMLNTWARRFRRCAVDPSGYLVQRITSGGCQPLDAPRGSGTALAAYFISFSHHELSQQLYHALREHGTQRLFGFAAINEYAPGYAGGGDINAGPIIMGLSVGATGFGLGAAKVRGDRNTFTQLLRTTTLFGLPAQVGLGRGYAAGGALGNALLLAMLTAAKP